MLLVVLAVVVVGGGIHSVLVLVVSYASGPPKKLSCRKELSPGHGQRMDNLIETLLMDST